MSIKSPPLTVEAFDEWVLLPENASRLFEFIAGEVVEVPSNAYASKIASVISGFLFMYLMRNKIGHLTGENGGYQVNGERYAPDVAFISFERAPQLDPKGYHPDAPDLAVEVISDESNKQEMTTINQKLANYGAAGVLVWIVYSEARKVHVYRPNQDVQVVGESGTLTGDDVISGFELPVSEIFNW